MSCSAGVPTRAWRLYNPQSGQSRIPTLAPLGERVGNSRARVPTRDWSSSFPRKRGRGYPRYSNLQTRVIVLLVVVCGRYAPAFRKVATRTSVSISAAGRFVRIDCTAAAPAACPIK